MQPSIFLSFAILCSVIILQNCFADDCGANCPASDSVGGGTDSCKTSLLAALQPFESPTQDDGCVITRFELIDGTFGPTDIPGLGILKRDQMFSTNILEHRKEAMILFKLLLSCKSFEDFKNAAFYYKSIVNPVMYTYVFSSAIINRRDTDTFSVPNLQQILPSHFHQSKVIQKSKNKIRRSKRKNLRKFQKRRGHFKKSIGRKGGSTGRKSHEYHHEKKKSHKRGRGRKKRQTQPAVVNQPTSGSNIVQIPLDTTLDDRYPEHRMAYFREDIGINSHHWHWHLVYPLFWSNGPNNIIKDRKGELFYYMHNQIVKRYNAERLGVGLNWVEPIPLQVSGPTIQEGYFPHLFSSTIGAEFTGRPSNLSMVNIVNHPQAGSASFADVIQWYNAVTDAINAGYMIVNSDKSQLPLDENIGIDILGSAVEASSWTPNSDLYGDIHNTGHVLLSYIHDPTGDFRASQGVMGFTETALRDPVFWRWHKMIDNLLNLHKAQLPPYSDLVLTWNDISITSVTLSTNPYNGRTFNPNECATYFRSRVLDISRGLDFEADNHTATVNITHLDHFPFSYTIGVTNLNANNVEGHVRIFISPKYAPDNHSMTDEEQRQASVEMDRFTIGMLPGSNTFIRWSQESAVTMTPNRQWAQLSTHDVEFKPSDDNDNFCGCGWPDHLLLPRGKRNGTAYTLFIMISNWSQEKVGDANTFRTCDDSLTMCGLLDKKFPDSRAMGFPLDRPIVSSNWFARPNMIRQDITIYHM